VSALYAIEVPRVDGRALGSTHFLSSAFAYETLSDKLKHELRDAKAVHSFGTRAKRHQAAGNRRNISQEQLDKAPDVEHPVFRRHPYCDKTCTYVSRSHTTQIVGVESARSQQLLEELFAHSERRDFTYSHEWEVGDVLIWDNTQTQHLATFDYPAHVNRRMHRVSIKGTIPYNPL